jgi:hypothetical protein
VDYQSAESQAIQLQQQANQVTQRLKDVADKLQAKIPDPNLSRELMLDLREAAIAIQQQNQSALAMIQQMAQYIHALESNLATAPQASFPGVGIPSPIPAPPAALWETSSRAWVWVPDSGWRRAWSRIFSGVGN